MRLLSRMGPVLLALAIACGPRSVSDEPEDITVVVPAPPVAEVTAPLPVSTPEPVSKPKKKRVRRRARRVVPPRLPAPTGLAVFQGYGLPLVSIGPVDWDGPLSVPQSDPALLASHLERVAAHEATLADLARTRYELSRALAAVVKVLPVLDGHTRLRAGLRVCALRRELEELERAQRQLQVEVVAIRELIAPAVRLAEVR